MSRCAQPPVAVPRSLGGRRLGLLLIAALLVPAPLQASEAEPDPNPLVVTLSFATGMSGSLAGEALEGFGGTRFTGQRSFNGTVRLGWGNGLGLSVGVVRTAAQLTEDIPPEQADTLDTFFDFGSVESTSLDVLAWWSFRSGRRALRPGSFGFRLGVGVGFAANDFRKGPTFRAIEDDFGFDARVEVDGYTAWKVLFGTDLTLGNGVTFFVDLGFSHGTTSIRAHVGEVVIVPDTTMNMTGSAVQIGLGIELLPRK